MCNTRGIYRESKREKYVLFYSEIKDSGNVTENHPKDEKLEGYFLSSFIRSLCLFVVYYLQMTKWVIRTSKKEKVNEIHSDCYLIINQKT